MKYLMAPMGFASVLENESVSRTIVSYFAAICTISVGVDPCCLARALSKPDEGIRASARVRAEGGSSALPQAQGKVAPEPII